MLETKNCIV